MGQVQFKTQAEFKQERLEVWRENIAVSAFQAEQALDDFGYLDQVDELMDSPETSKRTVRAWRKARKFRYMSPTIQEFKEKLGITDEQLDQLFEHAATIES